MAETFEQMLTGGHPNSLGRTLEVTEIVLKDKSRLEDMYQTYFSKDEVVRLRVSSVMKRVCLAHPEWLKPYIDRLLQEITTINQASTQWTLAILFLHLEQFMSVVQKEMATKHMMHNLEFHDDWIVQNTTIDTLSQWAKRDEQLRTWLIPHLEQFTKSHRKSVAGRAKKMLQLLG